MWKRRAPDNNEDPSFEIPWKSWIWDHYLPGNMEWTFGNVSEPFGNVGRESLEFRILFRSWRNWADNIYEID